MFSKSTLKKLYSNNFYIIGGIFFLLTQLFIIIVNINAQDYSFYYWFCNHTPLLLSIAFFTKKIQVIKGIVSVGLFPQMLWILDLIFNVFNVTLFGFTSYFFELESTLTIFSILLIHIFTTTIALLLVFLQDTKRSSLLYSFIYLVLLLIITFLFTNPANNTNCIYEICGLEQFQIPLYTLFWPFLTFIVFILPSYILQDKLSNYFKQNI